MCSAEVSGSLYYCFLKNGAMLVMNQAYLQSRSQFPTLDIGVYLVKVNRRDGICLFV